MIDHIGISVGSIARATEFYLIGNFRIEGVLLEGLDGARTWPPVRYLFYLSFRSGVHHFLAWCKILEVFAIARR